MLNFDGDSSFLDDLEAQELIRISNRTHHRAEMRLLNGTPARRVLDAALQHVDELYHFEVMEPPLSEIFVSVVSEQDATLQKV